MFDQRNAVARGQYDEWRAEQDGLARRIAADSDRLVFHVEPELGWLNDPNGLVQVGDVYHVYHQYDPFDAKHGGPVLWNHLTTRDFLEYENRGPALFPDSGLDSSGAYSGSAFVRDGKAHFFYTGNVKHFDRDDYDYVLTGREQNQIHLVVDAEEGMDALGEPGAAGSGEKHAVLTPADYPADIGTHVRDPKVLEHDGVYYMVLGARTRDDRGCVLVYTSRDLDNWQYATRIEPKAPFGYMWECPDLFELDGELFLVCCPQGVAPEGWRYHNPHQCVWFRVEVDWDGPSFRLVEDGRPAMVDAGFDFYAPQTFEDASGRRLMIGWSGCPDATVENTTVERGWQCALTAPRELCVRNGVLCQWPVHELARMRGTVQGVLAGEKVEGPGRLFDAVVRCAGVSRLELELREGVTLRHEDGMLTLDMRAEGHGRDVRSVEVGDLRDVRVLSDTTMLEVFANGGEVAMTTRTYSPAVMAMELRADGEAEMDFFPLAR